MTVTDLTSIRASTVPSVPKTITATQRLAALELARSIHDFESVAELGPYVRKLLLDCSSLLNELASDAKGER
jgi:hypothetical protein